MSHNTAEVQIWLWHLPPLSAASGTLPGTPPETLAAVLLPTLIPAEQALYHTIKSPRRQREYLAGHGLLRFALNSVFPQWTEQHHLSMDADQRLHLNGPLADSIDFNLSHSGDWVTCVAGRNCRVGIDIEQPSRRRAYRALAVEYFATAEHESLASLSDDACRERFYHLWTLKESYLKARKEGIFAAGLATEFVALEQAAADWYCYPFRMPTAPDVFAALTVSVPLTEPLVIRQYRTEKGGTEDSLTGSRTWMLEVPEPLTPRR